MPEITVPLDLKQKILQEARQYITTPKREGEFTVREFAETNDIEITNGQSILYRMIEDGAVTRRGEGRGKKVYYRFTEE